VSLNHNIDNEMLILGSSEATKRLRRLITQCADSTATVLIQGASGSGKELVSVSLHNQSSRFSQPFVALNCGAIPAQLLESELFGHKKGSFTGATCDRLGRFELAHEGTLFLDEIGDMPLDLQVKFLRVLEEKVVEPVGGSKAVEVDVRVVAATHRNIEKMVSEGKFREDLFYRLNIIPISVPPLKERSSDIPELIGHFAERFSVGSRPISFSRRSTHLLQSYSWPGNVRELSNLIQRLSVLFPEKKIELTTVPQEFLPSELMLLANQLSTLAEKPDMAHEAIEGLRAEFSNDSKNKEQAEPHENSAELDSVSNDFERIIELSDSIAAIPESGIPARDIIKDLESNLIRTALIQTEGNVSKAAELLTMGRTSVIQKISKYKIKIE
jgi:sigma-54 specific flagellar transcriptional regulator A